MSSKSLPSWERGLKCCPRGKGWCSLDQSLPSWERGLKFPFFSCIIKSPPGRSPRGSVDWNSENEFTVAGPGWSLPSWERGLKFVSSDIIYMYSASLPSWERGLKSFQTRLIGGLRCRSPRGSVDWNSSFICCSKPLHCRSPRGSVDWNRYTHLRARISTRSLPSWERGLKSALHPLTLLVATVAPLVGAWIEILVFW